VRVLRSCRCARAASGRRRAPRTCTTSWCVDEPAAVGLRRARRHAATSLPKSGSVTAPGEDFAGGESWQPSLLLLLVPLSPARESVSPDDDQRSTDAEGAPRQLLGPTTIRGTPIRHRTRSRRTLRVPRDESAELGESGDYRLGNIGVGPVHVFGVRANLFEGESMKGVSDHLEVFTEVTGPAFSRDPRRIADRGTWSRRPERTYHSSSTPREIRVEHSRREVTQRNREERGDESRFDLALRA